tara:strand:- start:1288 stop:2232 length:945 start_codon:yes stop_codon:yes gene_type:complete
MAINKEINMKKIWITASDGMVGKSLIRRLKNDNKYKVISTNRRDFDQTIQASVEEWLKLNSPDHIIICSSLVGGIHYNDSASAEILYTNSQINLNIINSAFKNGCRNLIFLGASCMYPKNVNQPLDENSLMAGKIEETNLGYGLSKILGANLVELYNKQYNTSYKCIIPAASYGPNDCFDDKKNHVIPALMNKIHIAKIENKSSINVWGSGNALREFIHVDDMADGIIYIMENYKGKSSINLGSGEEVSIRTLVKALCKIINYNGDINYDTSKPEGVKRKILNSSKLQEIGWFPKIPLEKGLEEMYEYYKDTFK